MTRAPASVCAQPGLSQPFEGQQGKAVPYRRSQIGLRMDGPAQNGLSTQLSGDFFDNHGHCDASSGKLP